MKKYILTLSVISLISFMGCYYTEQMKPEKIDFNENQDLKVVMTDTTYNLEADHYYYKNDTIYAIVSRTTGEESSSISEKQIPVDKIDNVEVEQFNYVLNIIAPLAVVSLIFLMLAAGGLLW